MKSLLTKFRNQTKWNGIPDLTLYIVLGQMTTLIVAQTNPQIINWLTLVPHAIYRGELWRLLTFILVTPSSPDLLWGSLWCYVFYLFGSNLEESWGCSRFTTYILIGYLCTAITAIILPSAYVIPSNFFLSSVFLAFAHLNPEFELLLFFILPVKVRWLALVTWIAYFLAFMLGNLSDKLIILSGVANFLMFFAPSLARQIKKQHWKMQLSAASATAKYHHKCVVCGITDVDDNEMEFRYCTKCKGAPCYCMKHLENHSHT